MDKRCTKGKSYGFIRDLVEPLYRDTGIRVEFPSIVNLTVNPHMYSNKIG